MFTLQIFKTDAGYLTDHECLSGIKKSGLPNWRTAGFYFANLPRHRRACNRNEQNGKPGTFQDCVFLSVPFLSWFSSVCIIIQLDDQNHTRERADLHDGKVYLLLCNFTPRSFGGNNRPKAKFSPRFETWRENASENRVKFSLTFCKEPSSWKVVT